MAWGTPARSEWPLRASRRVREKDAVVTDAREHLASDLGQVVTQSGRVVAGVEDEEGDFPILWKESDETADLFDGCA
jgi:hypothetical protein